MKIPNINCKHKDGFGHCNKMGRIFFGLLKSPCPEVDMGAICGFAERFPRPAPSPPPPKKKYATGGLVQKDTDLSGPPPACDDDEGETLRSLEIRVMRAKAELLEDEVRKLREPGGPYTR